jgi:TonB family protein
MKQKNKDKRMSTKKNSGTMKRLLISVALTGIVICWILVLPLTDDNPVMPELNERIYLRSKPIPPPPPPPPPPKIQIPSPGTRPEIYDIYNLDPPAIGAMVPRVMKRVEPVYPKAALKANLSGIVKIVVITTIYGTVARARVFRGHPLLRKAALEAVKQWLFEPYITDGVPKPIKFMVIFKFNHHKR